MLVISLAASSSGSGRRMTSCLVRVIVGGLGEPSGYNWYMWLGLGLELHVVRVRVRVNWG